MLPATAGRYTPAITIMKSITAWQEQTSSRNPAPTPSFVPAAPQSVAPSIRSAANEAVSALFSVHHVTANELIIKMVGHIAGRLNAELSANADHPDDTADLSVQKDKWRQTALKPAFQDQAADGDLTLPKPGTDGITVGEVAKIILHIFNHDYLAKHSELKKELEGMIGFHLGGLSLLDILHAAADPESSAAKRVDEALTRGLAGQEGDPGANGSLSVRSALAVAVYEATIREFQP